MNKKMNTYAWHFSTLQKAKVFLVLPMFLLFSPLSDAPRLCIMQDTFLPHVECGTVTLIGATTENPSFQVNAALLSRCRVLVLEKLSVEAMSSILRRAVASLGIRVLGEDPSDDPPEGDLLSDGSA